MISIGEKKASLYRGDYHPAQLYRGEQKIEGYKKTFFEGENITILENCYNDKLYDLSFPISVTKIVARGKNVLDMDGKKVYIGYYADGSAAAISNNRFLRIDPIPVKPLTTYTISCEGLCFYTIWFSKVASDPAGKISRIDPYHLTKTTFTTPEECNYIKVCWDKGLGKIAEVEDLKWVMLEEGTALGGYEEFVEPAELQPGDEIPTFYGTTVIETDGKIEGYYKEREVVT